jgi:hypothetical protein
MRLSPAELVDLKARMAGRASLAHMRDNPAERQKRSQKYGNEKVDDAGRTFDSKAEHKRWQYLAMLERAGEIRDLRCQVPFELIPAQVTPSGKKVRPTVYLADFTYTTKDGRFVCEDVKGAATDVWKLKKKLMLHVHGIEVQEVR